jgi:hypothetical protein
VRKSGIWGRTTWCGKRISKCEQGRPAGPAVGRPEIRRIRRGESLGESAAKTCTALALRVFDGRACFGFRNRESGAIEPTGGLIAFFLTCVEGAPGGEKISKFFPIRRLTTPKYRIQYGTTGGQACAKAACSPVLLGCSLTSEQLSLIAAKVLPARRDMPPRRYPFCS